MELGLKNKVALVTGASKGIGKAIAEEFAREGAHVAICARGKDELEQVAEALRQHGVTVHAMVADVAKPADCQQVLDETLQAFGRIDVLVNNAGTAWLEHTLTTTDDEWQACMEVNLHSAIRLTRGVVPQMRKQGGGRIVNISTVGAHTPSMFPDYATAKAGMLAFSKATSFELAPDNILINCVCPGGIHTPLWDTLADGLVGTAGKDRAEVLGNLASQYMALKRFGNPGDVAAMVAFLASDRAAFITGSSFDVDGGFVKSI